MTVSIACFGGLAGRMCLLIKVFFKHTVRRYWPYRRKTQRRRFLKCVFQLQKYTRGQLRKSQKPFQCLPYGMSNSIEMTGLVILESGSRRLVAPWTRSSQGHTLDQVYCNIPPWTRYSPRTRLSQVTPWIRLSQSDALHQDTTEWHRGPGHLTDIPWTKSSKGGYTRPGYLRVIPWTKSSQGDYPGLECGRSSWGRHSTQKGLRGGPRDLVYREGWSSLCLCLLLFFCLQHPFAQTLKSLMFQPSTNCLNLT